MLATRYPLLATRLRSYFYSGWAFLIPYLAVYLLYYVTKWPVNATAAAAGNGPEVIGHGPITHHLSPIPPLLHVYWAIHAIHAILAGVAIWGWVSSYRSKVQDPSIKGQVAKSNPAPTNYLLLPTSYSEIALRLAPWALLALLFYIPGVYLEWPSDPWEHLRRINEWRILDTVGAHSSWIKSAYFIPYSLLSWCIGLRQLFWLDFYYTGICLLLCWQYYRFSRACGLGERASMVFVIIQALLFGNNIFSFYRYYGISSSIYAQLGAIALTRIVLEFAARGTKLDPSLQSDTDEARQCVDGETRGLRQTASPEQSGGLEERVLIGRDDNKSTEGVRDTSGNQPDPFNAKPAEADPQTQSSQKRQPYPLSLFAFTRRASARPAAPLAPDAGEPRRFSVERSSVAAPQPFSFSALKPHLLSLITAVTCLTALNAFNHPQGLGIAGLGIAAIIVWRLIEWKRTALWWLIGGTIVFNALFLAFYARPPILETYRAQSYLNAWYGFNMLDLTSPAADRMQQIVALGGMLGVFGGTVLLLINHPVGWLSIFPILALLLPCVSIPLATSLSSHSTLENIVTFQRLLFAAPLYLPVVILCSYFWRVTLLRCPSIRLGLILPFLMLCFLNPGKPTYSRLWHSLSKLPSDISGKQLFESLASTPQRPNETLAAATMLNMIELARDPQTPTLCFGRLNDLPSYDLAKVIEGIQRPYAIRVPIPRPTALFTANSTAALVSLHWRPQQLQYGYAGAREIESASRARNCAPLPDPPGKTGPIRIFRRATPSH